MSGGKGGSTTSETTVPQYIEDAGRANLARADELAKIGYTPYYGPDVAAFTPMQEAAFQGTSDMANAFGMATPASQQDIYGGMGAPTQYANGVRGYSSAPMYEQSLAQFAEVRPGQYAAMMAPFIDPVTGRDPAAPFGNGSAAGKGGGTTAAAASSLTDQERLMGLTEGQKARGMNVADMMGTVSYTHLTLPTNREV